MPDIPSRVFPLPGWSGPIQNHWGVSGAVGGSDLMVTPGSSQSVVSMTNGTVVFTSTQQNASKSGGNAVEIKGPDGLYYYYAHLRDAPAIKVGDTIKVGQLLGIADSSGDASPSAPHLHIGIGHSIQEGVGAFGGTGTGFNAVGMLADLQARANIPSLGTASGQAQVAANQPAGTIQLNAPDKPVSADLGDRIRWLAQLLISAGVDPSKIPEMVAISLAENGSSNPTAKSSTNDYGLWQINWPSWGDALCKDLQICSLTALTNPANNAKAAAYVLAHQGVTAWSTYKNGAYQSHTGDVSSALSGVDLGSGSDITSGGSDTTDPAAECGKWTLLDTDIAGNHLKIEFPDVGCVLLKTLQQTIDNITSSFKLFVWQRTYDWGFNVLWGLVGFLFILIGGALIASDHPEVLAAAA